MTQIDIFEDQHCWHCALKYESGGYLDAPILELIERQPNYAKYKCTTCGLISEFYG